MSGSGRWIKAALGGVFLLGVALWFWPRPAPPPALPSGAGPPRAHALVSEPAALAPGVFILGKTSPAAAYAVATSEGLVLIDSGLEADAGRITEQLAQLGLEVGRLKAVLLTHVHGDHSLGAQSLRARTGAKVYAGCADCPPLRQGRPREAFFSTFALPDVEAHPTTVDVELAGEETLTFGQTSFLVLSTPGHTPGSVCYLMERPGLRALFTGDVVQQLDPSLPGALGTYAARLPPLYRGDARAYLASLRRLRDLPLPDLVLPGHPRMAPVPQNPRLTAQAWPALLDGGIADMEELLVRYQRDGANFLDGVPKELLPGLRYLGDLGGQALYALNTPRGLVVVDAPGGPSLVDFLARRLAAVGWQGRKPAVVLLTSLDERSTAGLKALVQQTRCDVAFPRSSLEAARRVCPEGVHLCAVEDLQKTGVLDVQVVPLRGLGRSPCAYQLRWSGKTVLLTGRLPARPAGPESAEQLRSEVRESEGGLEGYRESLDRLGRIRPDLWLPAVPVAGQNANVYANPDDWGQALEQSRLLLEG